MFADADKRSRLSASNDSLRNAPLEVQIMAWISATVRSAALLIFGCIALFLPGSAQSQRELASGAVVLSARLEAISVSAIVRAGQDLTAPFQRGSASDPFLIRTLLAIPPSLTAVRIFAYLVDGVSALQAGDHGETAIPASAVHIWFGKDDTDFSDPPVRSDLQVVSQLFSSGPTPAGTQMEQPANILNVQIDPQRLPKLPARGFPGTLNLVVQAL
jgi:hypothetical protein